MSEERDEFVPEPPATRFDVRGRVGGLPVRVNPGFWVAAAALGVRYYADPEAGGPGYFLFWLLAAFIAVLMHEFAHAVVARAFGASPHVFLYGLGGLTTDLDAIPQRGRRILARLAGSLVSFILVALIWGITFLPFPHGFHGWETPLGTGLALFLWANYYWGLWNLLPLWPLDGGQVARDVLEGLFGRRGRGLAIFLSIVVTAVLAVGIVMQLTLHLEFPYHPRYAIYLQSDLILLVFCFLLWLRAFQALWSGGQAELDPPTLADRRRG